MYILYREEREGGGRGERKEGDIYIYMIYRVDCFLSVGVVAMRQLALLCMFAHSLHELIRARIHIYTSVFSHEGTYTYARAHPRENVHTHAHDAYEHKVHACIRTRHMHACTRAMLIHAYVRARCTCARTRVNTRPHICLHMRPHSCKHTPTYFGCALTDWGHTPQQ